MSYWSVEFVDKKSKEDFVVLDIDLKARFVHILKLINTFGFFNVDTLQVHSPIR